MLIESRDKSLSPYMKYQDMENGTVWQELLPGGNDHSGRHQDKSAAGQVSPSPDAGEPTFASRGKTLTKHLSLYALPKFGDGQTMGPGYRYPVAKIVPSRIRKRVVTKNGNVNIARAHVSKRSQRYLQDIFTTLVDIQWRWNLMVFAMGFVLSWLGFGVIWWLISFAHGDLEHLGEDGWEPCVQNIKSFASAFLFSIETQHTIGYGYRYTNEECPEAIFIMCLQSITGVMIQCFMVGIVFAKLSRPKKRSQTLMFSRSALVALRDGRLCFMFRLGDMRKSQIIGATVSAHCIRKKVTAEGEVIPYYHSTLDVRFDDGDHSIFLIWPATVVHEIDEKSPFFTMSAEDMLRDRFEVVVILEGTIESTGQYIQARSSYLPNEMLWGHRFEQLVCFSKETGEYVVDYSKFNNTYEIETPLCCARDYYEYQRLVASMAENGGVNDSSFGDAPSTASPPPPASNSLESLRKSEPSTADILSTASSSHIQFMDSPTVTS